ncbi:MULTISPECIES: DUF998 domain-containing protein [unclassified Nocardiopsis]|uniref:DUF998 domain-containing protein n=1 Tax=unclassified Nocardiopsis TaxID=2649073 RepID=UPI001357B859|nr:MULTISPECIES: DUF998 domain-containing protein [unclassified Nocardiopsis]
MPHSAQLHWDYRDGRVAAVAAAIVYSLWVLEAVLPGGGAVQGALADQGTTFARFMESAHRTGAVLVMLTAGLGLGLGAREETGHLLAASWWCMAVFGAASLAATLFPGPCLVSTDVACAAESLTEGLPGATVAQAVLAALALLAALASVVVLAVDRWRQGDRSWPLVAVLALLQLLAAAALLVMAVRVYAAGGDGEPGAVFGVLQRAHLVTVSLWLLAAGLLPRLWRRTPSAPRTGASH